MQVVVKRSSFGVFWHLYPMNDVRKCPQLYMANDLWMDFAFHVSTLVAILLAFQVQILNSVTKYQ